LEVFSEKLPRRIFYDADRITRSSDNTVGIWLKIVYSENFLKEEGLDELTQTIGLWEINCKEKKVCLLSTSHHSKAGEISPPKFSSRQNGPLSLRGAPWILSIKYCANS